MVDANFRFGLKWLSSCAGKICAAQSFCFESVILETSHADLHMTACQKCNTENLDGSQYCDECGAPLNLALVSNPAGNNSGKDSMKSRKSKTKAEKSGQKAEGAVSAGLLEKESSAQVSVADGPHAKLVIERGRSAGKQFLLNGDESQIGRWDADGGIFPDVDLDVDDPEAKVSRRHAKIMNRGGNYYVEDLGSTNGTFINRGRRLLPGDRQPLRDGDEIIVGKTFLRFHVLK